LKDALQVLGANKKDDEFARLTAITAAITAAKPACSSSTYKTPVSEDIWIL